MELVPYADRDLELTVTLETDPVVMRSLGGPLSRRQAEEVHRRRLAGVARGDWFFTVVPDPATGPIGIVGIWQTEWRGERIHELGTMALPRFQGRGLTVPAFDTLLRRARAERKFRHLHAFPAVDNGPSNAVCRKLGFTLRGECELDYEGRDLRCNHWVLDLAP